MSHSPTVDAINQYANDAVQHNDPVFFLRRFSPLHNRWHTTSLRHNIGFLVFHWHVVAGFRTARCDTIWPGGVTAFTEADWQNTFHWPYDVNVVVNNGDFGSLAGFSSAIELWHNEAHMAVENVTGEDLMNPLTNVFIRNFWRLHYFINTKFEAAMSMYDPAGPSMDAKIDRLETNHHNELGRI